MLAHLSRTDGIDWTTMDDARRPDARRVAELARRVFDRGPWGSRGGIDPDAVAALAATRSVLALPSLVDLALEHRVRDIVADAIETIVATSDPARLPAADAQVRSGWPSRLWAGITAEAFEHEAAEAGNPTGVLLAGGMCRNGFVRQRALSLLIDQEASSSDAMVRLQLLRANDWVPQIRLVALAGLRSTADEAGAPTLIRALPLIQRLHAVKRLDDPRIAERLTGAVVARGWSDLLAGFDAEHLSVRRSSVQLALSTPHDRRTAAAERVLERVADPVSRDLAAQALIAGDPHDGVAVRLLRDHTTQVRLTALEHLVLAGAADTAMLIRALTDPSRRMRAVVQYHAARAGVDVAAHYRTCLDAHPSDPVCIRGLGEVGAPVDAHRLVAFATHERVGVRAAAVAAVGRLDPSGHQDVLFRAVTDSSPRVGRAARHALGTGGGALDPDKVASCIAASTEDHAVTNAVRLVDHADRWAQPWLYLEALPGLTPPAARVAVDGLERWEAGYGRTWHTTPSPRDLVRSRRALAYASDDVPPQLHASLSDAIAS